MLKSQKIHDDEMGTNDDNNDRQQRHNTQFHTSKE